MPDYADLTTDDQVAVLREVALRGAAAFGLEVASLDLVLHAFNTTFRVDTTDGRTLALRVNTNSMSTPAHITAQQAWIHAITADTELLVPDPVATPEGGYFVEVACPPAGRPLSVVVNSWLEGPDVDTPDEEQAGALGRAMATLHRQSAGWAPPTGATLTLFDSPLFGDPDALADWPFSTDQRAIVDEAFRRTQAAFAAAFNGRRPQVIHADLHGGNLKWHGGRLAIFDFDDCGWGLPELDLAISLFYLRGGTQVAERALLDGYADVSPLPDLGRLDALMAGRQLLLANSLVGSLTADLRAESEQYLALTVHRLRGWLATGRFERSSLD